MDPAQLDKVALVARSEESRAASAHQEQQRNVNASEERLGQLEQFRCEYEKRLEAMAATGMDARQMSEYRRFLSSLDEAISRQGVEVARGHENLSDRRENLVDRSLRRGSLDELIGRTRAALLQDSERREQRIVDEQNIALTPPLD